MATVIKSEKVTAVNISWHNQTSISVPRVFQIRASKAEAKVSWTNQPAEDEKDYSNCDLEVMSQSLILPPTDRPYFLLLQGYDQSKARHVYR